MYSQKKLIENEIYEGLISLGWCFTKGQWSIFHSYNILQVRNVFGIHQQEEQQYAGIHQAQEKMHKFRQVQPKSLFGYRLALCSFNLVYLTALLEK